MNFETLNRLIDASWSVEADSRRDLYATADIPGFPWYFVAAEGCAVERSGDPVWNEAFGSAMKAQRHVVPYLFTFNVFAKGRWSGRNVLDVYTEEFSHHTRSYYEMMIANGWLRVGKRQSGEAGVHNLRRAALRQQGSCAAASLKVANGTSGMALDVERATTTDAQTVLGQGDVIYHTVHRHEIPTPVTAPGSSWSSAAPAAPVAIVAIVSLWRVNGSRALPDDAGATSSECMSVMREEGLYLVVSKPPGLPTHPSGRYRYNSVTEMLAYVLAPKRLRAWLLDRDPLLQSVVSTQSLSPGEQELLHAYYSTSGGTGGELTEMSSVDFMSRVCDAHCPRPCHRLDKVTSGLLLLATTAGSARRLGNLLMAKSKEMDSLAEQVIGFTGCSPPNEQDAPLTRPMKRIRDSPGGGAAASTQPRSSAEETPWSLERLDQLVGEAVANAILHRPLDLQKEYLARVHGEFPAEALKKMNLVRDAVQQSGSNGVTPREVVADYVRGVHAIPRDVVLSSALLAGSSAFEVENHSPVPPTPTCVLILSPVSRLVHSVEDVSLGADHGVGCPHSTAASSQSPAPAPTAGVGGRRLMEQTAATLCQLLEYDADANTSLVRCFPLTGRTHQLRIHLSAWGHAIVGDTAYRQEGALPYERVSSSPPANTVRIGPRGLFKEDRTVAKPDTTAAAVTGEEAGNPLYFDPSTLPPRYRDRFFARQWPAAAAVESPGTASPHHALATLPCDECAGRLAISPAKSHEGTCIALHASRYRIRAAIWREFDTEAVCTPPESINSSMGVQEPYMAFEVPLPAWVTGKDSRRPHA